MKKQVKEIIRKVTYMGSMAALGVMMFPVMAEAKGIGSSVIITGTKELANDLTKALVGLSIVIGGLMEVYLYIRLQAADDEEKRSIKKTQKTTLYATVGATVVTGILAIIVGYYA